MYEIVQKQQGFIYTHCFYDVVPKSGKSNRATAKQMEIVLWAGGSPLQREGMAASAGDTAGGIKAEVAYNNF